MKSKFQFPGSHEEVDARWILENSTISWPQDKWLYCRYPDSDQHIHIEVEDGRMRTIEVVGAPGPDWRALESLLVPLLQVGIENDKINCWLDGELFVFPAKQ